MHLGALSGELFYLWRKKGVADCTGDHTAATAATQLGAYSGAYSRAYSSWGAYSPRAHR